jgi:hypothetical protein
VNVLAADANADALFLTELHCLTQHWTLIILLCARDVFLKDLADFETLIFCILRQVLDLSFYKAKKIPHTDKVLNTSRRD